MVDKAEEARKFLGVESGLRHVNTRIDGNQDPVDSLIAPSPSYPAATSEKFDMASRAQAPSPSFMVMRSDEDTNGSDGFYMVTPVVSVVGRKKQLFPEPPEDGLEKEKFYYCQVLIPDDSDSSEWDTSDGYDSRICTEEDIEAWEDRNGTLLNVPIAYIDPDYRVFQYHTGSVVIGGGLAHDARLYAVFDDSCSDPKNPDDYESNSDDMLFSANSVVPSHLIFTVKKDSNVKFKVSRETLGKSEYMNVKVGVYYVDITSPEESE